MELALRRLNGAMIRIDVADAVLDATIALEILLGDGDGQAIGYKLRLRAATLANLLDPGSGPAVSVAVKGTYEARSRIVHGVGRKSKAKADNGAQVRDTALGALRTEAPRVSRRLPLVNRSTGNEQDDEQVFA